ncbi:hypothetical protein ACO0RG_004739 [Hanseniaspora osmophila]|mgnify:FL=1
MQGENNVAAGVYPTDEPGTPLAEEGAPQPELAELDQDDLMLLDVPSCDNIYLKGNPAALNATNISNKRALEEVNQSDMEMDDVFEETDTYKPSIQFNDRITTPPVYPTISEDLQKEVSKKKYSSNQQIKFMNFCEKEFMKIQRKYVQSRGLKLGETPKYSYYAALLPLLQDYKRIVDFVWYSMDTSCKNTENLIPSPLSTHSMQLGINTSDATDEAYNDGHYSFVSLRRLLNEAQNIGQVYILLKISDDLMDYIEKFNTNGDSDKETIKFIFMLHFILDRIFSLLIVEDTEMRYGVYMTPTEIVRCKGICERTRIRLSKYFQDCEIKGFHYELSKIYELTLERI